MQGGHKTDKVLYKDLSYKIVGVLFDVYNELGYGHPEKYYYKAIERSLMDKKIKYISQARYKLMYKGEEIGRYYLDYLIEDKIVLEIKKGNYFSKKNLEQIMSYLKATKLELAILINITSRGIKFYRLLNSRARI